MWWKFAVRATLTTGSLTSLPYVRRLPAPAVAAVVLGELFRHPY
jgi:hypothetical protein